MSSLLRREVPIAICAIVALLMIFDNFFMVPASIHALSTEFKYWGTILAAFTLLLGIITVVRVNIYHISRKTEDRWVLALWSMIVFSISSIIGLLWTPDHPAYLWLYDNILMALWIAMLATTGFFITSAAYRAFRAHTKEAALLLIPGLFVVAKNTPALVAIWPPFLTIGDWIMAVGVGGGTRGLVIGAAIGTIATGLRTILGYETGYLGKLKEK